MIDTGRYSTQATATNCNGSTWSQVYFIFYDTQEVKEVSPFRPGWMV